jgi:hypothetical protein
MFIAPLIMSSLVCSDLGEIVHVKGFGELKHDSQIVPGLVMPISTHDTAPDVISTDRWLGFPFSSIGGVISYTARTEATMLLRLCKPNQRPGQIL